MVFSFKQFISEDSDSPEPTKLADGSTVYSHTIGPHKIHTLFYPRENSKGTKDYDMHFVRSTEGKGGGGFSRRGMSDMESSHRIKAIHSVMKATKHFVASEKPDSIIAAGNTKKKKGFAQSVMGKVVGKGGSVKQVGNETVGKFSK